MILNNNRAQQLLQLIENRREVSWRPIITVERSVMISGIIIREFIDRHNKESIEKSVASAGWSMGMEILRFMGSYHADEDKAYAIVVAAGRYNDDMRTGILDDVYDYCVKHNEPPQWVLASMINPKEQDEENHLVINPKGVKI